MLKAIFTPKFSAFDYLCVIVLIIPITTYLIENVGFVLGIAAAIPLTFFLTFISVYIEFKFVRGEAK